MTQSEVIRLWLEKLPDQVFEVVKLETDPFANRNAPNGHATRPYFRIYMEGKGELGIVEEYLERNCGAWKPE